MDKPIKSTSGRKMRADMKVDGMVKRKGTLAERPRRVVKKDITKDEFLANLGKVCQPIGKESIESDSGKSGT